MGGESKAQMGPTVLRQARIPRDLARSLEDDMRILGLDSQSEAIREVLRLLHRHAREIAVAQAYDEFYGGRPAPLSPYVAALYGEDGTAGADPPFMIKCRDLHPRSGSLYLPSEVMS